MFFIYSILTTIRRLTTLILSPINLGLTILIIALSTSIIFALIYSSWIAFLLFLIYIRGILIIFAYFVTLSPNIPINISKPILITIPIITYIIFLENSLYPPLTTFQININTFYSPLTRNTLIILALVLLLTIVIVVKITSSTKGPLRPFNYVQTNSLITPSHQTLQ